MTVSLPPDEPLEEQNARLQALVPSFVSWSTPRPSASLQEAERSTVLLN